MIKTNKVMTEKEIEKAAIEHQSKHYIDGIDKGITTDPIEGVLRGQYYQSKASFIDGAEWALSHQWHTIDDDSFFENEDDEIFVRKDGYCIHYNIEEIASDYRPDFVNDKGKKVIDFDDGYSTDDFAYWMPLPKIEEEKK
jgi:hypothetical protein